MVRSPSAIEQDRPKVSVSFTSEVMVFITSLARAYTRAEPLPNSVLKTDKRFFLLLFGLWIVWKQWITVETRKKSSGL